MKKAFGYLVILVKSLIVNVNPIENMMNASERGRIVDVKISIS